MLVKKDRGRPTNPKARPKAYGEVSVASDVPGIELLQHNDGDCCDNDNDEDDTIASGSDDDLDQVVDSHDGEDNQIFSDSGASDEDELTEDVDSAVEVYSDSGADDEENADNSNEMELEVDDEDEDSDEKQDEMYDKEAVSDENIETDSGDTGTSSRDSKLKKRKFSDFDQRLITADSSLRALKRLAGTVVGQSSESTDGILSNEDFQRIKELKVTLCNSSGFVTSSKCRL